MLIHFCAQRKKKDSDGKLSNLSFNGLVENEAEKREAEKVGKREARGEREMVEGKNEMPFEVYCFFI